MIKNNSVLAVILARGGSKRLPNKNILALGGKPLIAWSIEAARKSKYIDRVIVSTDSAEIAKISKKYGADVPFLRPKNLADDTASSNDAIFHALNWLKSKEKKIYDLFVLLQPTSPLRTEKHIDQALDKFIKKKEAYSLVSVSEVDKNPYWTQIADEQGYIRPLFSRPGIHWTEQVKQKLYIPNGAIYIVWTNKFLQSKQIYSSKTGYYEMDKNVSIDIDYEDDLRLAEFFYKENNK